MSYWVQNILVIGLVGVCAVWAVWQGYRSIAGKRSRLGSCCQKGCGAGEKAAGKKVHFLPVESLKRRAS